MIKIEGDYFDGRSSSHISVVMKIDNIGGVVIRGHNLEIKTTVKRLKISARLANTPRSIYLPKGAKLEIPDNKAIDQVCAYFDKNILQTFLYKIEKNGSIVLLSLFISILFIWGGIEYGVPFAAKWAVKAVPYQVEQDLGEQGLQALDKWLFVKSSLKKTDQIQIQQQFKRVVLLAEKPFNYRLELRDSKQMGANALALPGGIIIMTDGLFKLAENNQQIMAVLAHEVGHIEYQHGLRALLQNSITALFMAGILGDITSISSLAVALPTMLVESRYSREFELESDQYAIDFLKDQQIDLKHYAKILRLLEQPGHSTYKFDYLSSHPAMDKRIEIINNSD